MTQRPKYIDEKVVYKYKMVSSCSREVRTSEKQVQISQKEVAKVQVVCIGTCQSNTTVTSQLNMEVLGVTFDHKLT